jgi:hypothetical protein
MLALTLFCCLPAAGAPHAIPAHRHSLLPGAASVTVVQLPGGASLQSMAGAAVAELGTVSSNARNVAPGIAIVRRAKSYLVRTAIGLQTSGSGTASLEAFLDSMPAGIVVRVDGVQLTTSPQVFAANVPAGVVTHHRIELEIPNSLSPGMVPSEIPLEFGATAQ